MGTLIRFIFPLLLFAVSVTAQAGKKAEKTVYAFAYGTCFSDSVAYISVIAPVKGATLQRKSHFLDQRAELAASFKSYLDNKWGKIHTTAVFFSTKKKDLEKKIIDLRKLALKRHDLQLVELGVDDFTLALPATE